MLKRPVLEKIAGDFQDFDGKQIHENRTKLSDLIKKTITQGFDREDKENVVVLSKYHGMDIMIGVGDGKIWVNTDGLWKTIYGLYEQDQEQEAYMRDPY